MEPTITRMYRGGPLRLFSEEKFLGGRPYKDAVREGFVSQQLICELCQRQARELIVVAGEWICKNCLLSAHQKRDARGCKLKATRRTG
jgi:hypothetical protein